VWSRSRAASEATGVESQASAERRHWSGAGLQHDVVPLFDSGEIANNRKKLVPQNYSLPVLSIVLSHFAFPNTKVDDDKGTFDLQAINLFALPTAEAEIPLDATATNTSESDAATSGATSGGAGADSAVTIADSGGPVEEWLGGLEVDAAGRSALYHASLEQRGPKSDVARLLLSTAPTVLDLADENGDTVAHAAAAFSPTTLALVLQRASLEDEAAEAAAAAAVGANAGDGASSKWKAAAAAASAATSLVKAKHDNFD